MVDSFPAGAGEIVVDCAMAGRAHTNPIVTTRVLATTLRTLVLKVCMVAIRSNVFFDGIEGVGESQGSCGGLWVSRGEWRGY